MSFKIAFLLTLLVLPSLRDASALKDYFLEDIKRTSWIRLEGEYKQGFVLKNFPGAKPFEATLNVLLGDIDGLVFFYNAFKLDSSQNRTTCWKDRDVLYLDSRYAEGEFDVCADYIMEIHPKYPLVNEKVTIIYTRRENSTSRFELTLTAFTDPPCGEKFECRNKICVSTEMRCDGQNNCGDGSDERGCNGTCADGSVYPGCNSPDRCGDLFDESGCDATDNSRDGKEGTNVYIFLYVALGIVLFVCLACIGIRWQEIFKKCCKRRADTETA